MATIVWREWFNADAVERLKVIGALPRNETEIDERFLDGEAVAEAVAEQANKEDFEQFVTGGRIVILEPEEFAGTYEISTEYEPVFYAHRQ